MGAPPTFLNITGALGLTWGLFGLAWLWDRTSPLGWWTLKPKTEDEREMARYYQRGIHQAREPGAVASSAAVGVENLPARFVQASGRMAQARIGDPNVEAHQERLDREAHKLWLRMRREAARELLEQQLHDQAAPTGPLPRGAATP